MMLRISIYRAPFLLPMFLLIGCGPPAEVRPELQPAHGSLMINGEPAEGAMLVLHPTNGESFDSRGTRPKATVKGDGSFDLTTYQTGDGAPVGDYDVGILWFADPDANSPWDKLAGRLANPKQTNIQITVEEGKTELEPIEINGVRILTRKPPQRTHDFDQVD